MSSRRQEIPRIRSNPSWKQPAWRNQMARIGLCATCTKYDRDCQACRQARYAGWQQTLKTAANERKTKEKFRSVTVHKFTPVSENKFIPDRDNPLNLQCEGTLRGDGQLRTCTNVAKYGYVGSDGEHRVAWCGHAHWCEDCGRTNVLTWNNKNNGQRWLEKCRQKKPKVTAATANDERVKPLWHGKPLTEITNIRIVSIDRKFIQDIDKYKCVTVLPKKLGAVYNGLMVSNAPSKRPACLGAGEFPLAIGLAENENPCQKCCSGECKDFQCTSP